MTKQEILDLIWQASKSGRSIRDDWLDEFVRHPDGQERLRDLLSDGDVQTQAALAGLLHQFADAPRRNASRPRRKTTEAGSSWQRELAAFVVGQEPDAEMVVQFCSLPLKRSHDEADPEEQCLRLCGGKWLIFRDPDDRVVCVEDATGVAQSISRARFDTYLKQARKSAKVSRGG